MDDIPEPIERAIRLPGVTIDGLLVTPLGGGLYRLEESGLFLDLELAEDESELHRVVRCTEHADGSLEFVEFVRPSPWKLHSRGLPRGVAESPELARWLETVRARGWHWERLFGGLLLVHAPPDAEVDVQAELDAVLKQARGQ